MDRRRVPALVLFVSLFLPWYEVEGPDAAPTRRHRVRGLLDLRRPARAGGGSRALRCSWSRPCRKRPAVGIALEALVTTVAGVVAILLVCPRAQRARGPRGAGGTPFGTVRAAAAWIGLAAPLGCFVGSIVAMRDERLVGAGSPDRLDRAPGRRPARDRDAPLAVTLRPPAPRRRRGDDRGAGAPVRDGARLVQHHGRRRGPPPGEARAAAGGRRADEIEREVQKDARVDRRERGEERLAARRRDRPRDPARPAGHDRARGRRRLPARGGPPVRAASHAQRPGRGHRHGHRAADRLPDHPGAGLRRAPRS